MQLNNFSKEKIIPIIIIFISFLLIYKVSYGSVIFLVVFFYLFLLYKGSKTKNKLYFILILAFTVRLLFILLDYFYGLVPYSWDTSTFHQTAILIKNNILNFRYIFFNIGESLSVKSYSFFVSIIYLIFGSYEINIRVINAFMGIYIAKKAYDITLIAGLKKSAAKWVLYLLSFWPSFILYTSINMRDPLIILLTLNLIKSFFLVKKQKINIVFIILDLIFIFYLRVQNLPLFILIFIFYFFIKKLFDQKMIYKVIAIILILISFLSLFYIINYNIIDFLNINYIKNEMEGRTRGGSAYLEWIDYNSIFDVIRFLPLRMVYFLFGPFLWDLKINNLMILFSFFEAFIFLFLFIFGFKNIFNKRNLYNDKLLFLIIFLFIGAAGYASITANYGTAIRHKMTFMIIIFILISQSLAKYKIKF